MVRTVGWEEGERETGRVFKEMVLSSSNMSKERHKPADSRPANFKEAKVKEKAVPGDKRSVVEGIAAQV